MTAALTRPVDAGSLLSEVSTKTIRLLGPGLRGVLDPVGLDEMKDDVHEKTHNTRSDSQKTDRAVNRILHGGGVGRPMVGMEG